MQEEWRNLQIESQTFKKMAYAESTKSTYTSMRNTFLRFCLHFGVTPVPASRETLLKYQVFLARSLAPSSISGYMNVVRLMHLEAGFHNPLQDWELSVIFKGIRRQLGSPPQQKLPVTIEILQQISTHIDLSSNKNIVFWGACLIGFFGFLRKSSLLPKSPLLKDRCKSICRKDVSLEQDGDVMSISIRHSKTIQFGERQLSIPFHSIKNSMLCPVQSVINILAGLDSQTVSDSLPLFTHVDGNGKLVCLTHGSFVHILKDVLGKCVFYAKLYNGHSFRRGGTTFAFSVCIPSLLIKLRGDWRSNAYERYVFISKDQQYSTSKSLSSYVTKM